MRGGGVEQEGKKTKGVLPIWNSCKTLASLNPSVICQLGKTKESAKVGSKTLSTFCLFSHSDPLFFFITRKVVLVFLMKLNGRKGQSQEKDWKKEAAAFN